MVIVDTSIWVSHLRTGSSRLKALLENEEVLCHPLVVGELACGYIRNRTEIISLLQSLPMSEVAGHGEILQFIESHGLMGVGLGLIDVHLLAAAFLSGSPLWTSDRYLRTASVRLGINYR